MHQAAYQWVKDHARPASSVLEVGSKDINGTPRSLFPEAAYTGLDLVPGHGVDVVADVVGWEHDPFDVVLCLEVLEHVEKWEAVIEACHRLCSGLLIVTCAGPGRAPHSASDGGPVRDGEWYANVDPGDLWRALERFGDSTVNVYGTDVRAVATK